MNYKMKDRMTACALLDAFQMVRNAGSFRSLELEKARAGGMVAAFFFAGSLSRDGHSAMHDLLRNAFNCRFDEIGFKEAA